MGEIDVNETLKSIYYNIKNPASFSTVEKLYEACDRKVSKEEIADWLSGQLTYTLHKPRKINYKRNAYLLDNINVQLQADLIDMATISEENDGVKYILIVIDAFSRFLRVRPLKTKAAKDVLEAFKSIFDELDEPPAQVLTDRGKEFFNSLVGNFLKSQHVKHIAPSDDTFKCAIVERAIRTFKGVLYKVLTSTFKLRYIDVLPEIVEMINSRKHRSINMAPKDVNENNIYTVWKFMHDRREGSNIKTYKNLLNPGDFLRISKNKNAFEKGFLPNYTDEIFKVLERIDHPHPVYRVEDEDGEKLESFLYHDEVIKVKKNENTLYRINKILKKRKRKGIQELLVEWKGGENKRKKNSWIPETDIV